MNTFNITLDLNKNKFMAPIRLRQGDLDGTTITALILDHGATADLTGLSARFVMELPGGEHYYRKDATVGEGSVTVVINEEQAASVTGRTTRAYFQLLDGETVRASTGSVTVDILPDALEGHTVPADYDSAIQDAIDALDDAVENIADTVEDVLEDHPEWTTTVQDGAVTDAKLYQGADGILARNARLMYRLDNLLTSTPVESDSLTVTDAARTPMAGLALYGRSTQDGTPTPDTPVPIQSVMPNLYHLTRQVDGTNVQITGMSNVSVVDEVLTFTATSTNPYYGGAQSAGNAYVGITGFLVPVKEGLTYSLYVSNTQMNQLIVTGYNASKVSLGYSSPTVSGGKATYTVPSGTAYIAVRIGLTNATSGTTYSTSFAVYEGEHQSAYVPYGNIGLWAAGRNLLKLAPHTVTFADVPITVTNESVTYNGTASSGGGGRMHALSEHVTLPAGTYRLSIASLPANLVAYVERTSDSAVLAGTDRSQIFILSEPTSVYLGINMTPSATFSNAVVSGIQIEVGSVAHDYQPCESVTIPIDLDGHELRSLPDGTRDEVTVDQYGRVVLTQRVGAAVIDGSNIMSHGVIAATDSGTGVRHHIGVLPNAYVAANMSEVAKSLNFVCDHFFPSRGAFSSAIFEPGQALLYRYDANSNFIAILPASCTTIALGNAWLAENPVTVLYPLATPVTIDLGYVAAVPLCGPDLTAQSVPTAPFALTYERDLNVTLARLEAAIAELA